MSETEHATGFNMEDFEELCAIEEAWDTSSAVLSEIMSRPGARALSVNLQGSSWLPGLSSWVGPGGEVAATWPSGVANSTREFDADYRDWVEKATAATADRFNLANLRYVARAEAEQAAPFDLVVSYRALYGASGSDADAIVDWGLSRVAPGGWFLIVEFDYRSWTFAPPAPKLQALKENIIKYAERYYELDYTANRLPLIFSERGLHAQIHAGCAALPPGNLLQHKSVDAAAAGSGVSDPLRDALGGDVVDEMRREAKAEVEDARRWTMSPTIVTAFAQVPHRP